MLNSFAGWYIDDLILASTDAQILHADFNLIETLLKRVGHSPQLQKTYLIAHPSVAADISSLFGPDLPVQNYAKVFGAQLSFSKNGLIVSCDNSEKLAALESISQFDIDKTILSKRDYFKLGGILGYDLSRQHPEERLLADCLRSISGRVKLGWSSPINLRSVLDERQQQAIHFIRDWAISIIPNLSLCSHPSPFDLSTSLMAIDVFTDASHTGGAFIITCGGFPIWEEAFRWTKTKVRWHSNRLECYTLWAAIRCVADILQCFHHCANQPEKRLSVTFHSDNRSAVGWASTGTLIGGKQQRRSMQRMLDSIAEELRLIRRFANVSVTHIPGATNAEADRLSRLCAELQPLIEGDEVPLETPTLADIIRKRKIPARGTKMLMTLMFCLILANFSMMWISEKFTLIQSLSVEHGLRGPHLFPTTIILSTYPFLSIHSR